MESIQQDSFSFDTDELSCTSSSSELFESGELGDISELLEDFERHRGEARKDKDAKGSKEQKKTEDVESRITMLEKRRKKDDVIKSEQNAASHTSKIPLGIASTDGSGEILNIRERFKENEDKDIGDEMSRNDHEGIERIVGKDLNSRVTNLSLENTVFGKEETVEITTKGDKSLVNPHEEDRRVSKQSNASLSGFFLDSENHVICEKDAKYCQRLTKKSNLQSTAFSQESGNQKNNVELTLEISSLQKGEKMVENDQDSEIASLIYDVEMVNEKEMINENKNDKKVKENDLVDQELVKDAKHLEDIGIPSLSSVNDENRPNNENEKNVVATGLNKESLVRNLNRGRNIAFYSLPLSGGKKKGQSNIVDHKKVERKDMRNDSLEEYTSHEEDIHAPLFSGDTKSCSDDTLNYENDRKVKEDDFRMESNLLTFTNYEKDTVMSSKENGCVDEKVKDYDLRSLTYEDEALTESDDADKDYKLDSDSEEKVKAQDLKKDVLFDRAINLEDVETSPVNDDGRVKGYKPRNNDDNKMKDQEWNKSDLEKPNLTHKDFKIPTSNGRRVDEKISGNCENDKKMKAGDWNNAYLQNITTCEGHEDVENSRLSDSGGGMLEQNHDQPNKENDKKVEEELDLNEDELVKYTTATSDINETQHLSSEEERVIIINNSSRKEKVMEKKNLDRSKDNTVSCTSDGNKLHESQQNNNESTEVIKKPIGCGFNVNDDKNRASRKIENRKDDANKRKRGKWNHGEIDNETCSEGGNGGGGCSEDGDDVCGDHSTDVDDDDEYVVTSDDDDEYDVCAHTKPNQCDENIDNANQENVDKTDSCPDVASGINYGDYAPVSHQDSSNGNGSTVIVNTDIKLNPKHDSKGKQKDCHNETQYDKNNASKQDIVISEPKVLSACEDGSNETERAKECDQNSVPLSENAGIHDIRYSNGQLNENLKSQNPGCDRDSQLLALHGKLESTEVPANNGKKSEKDVFLDKSSRTENMNALDYERHNSAKLKKEGEEDLVTGIVAESSSGHLDGGGTLKLGASLSSEKTPVPPPRRNRKTNPEASPDANADDFCLSRTPAKEQGQKGDKFSSKVSSGEKQRRFFENFSSLINKDPLAAEDKKGNYGPYGFERERSEDDKTKEGHIKSDTYNEGIRISKNESNCERRSSVDGAQHTSPKNKSRSEGNNNIEKETFDCFDSENYLLPKDLTTFNPPYCSTPCSEEATVHKTFDAEMKSCKDSTNYEIPWKNRTQPNGKTGLSKSNNENVCCLKREDEEEIDNEANYDKTTLCQKEDDGTAISNRNIEDIRDNVSYDDNESIYATSIKEDMENRPTKYQKDLYMVSPVFEDLGLGFQEVTSSRGKATCDDSMDRRQQRMSHADKRIDQTLNERKNHKTRAKRHQQAFVKHLCEQKVETCTPSDFHFQCTEEFSSYKRKQMDNLFMPIVQSSFQGRVDCRKTKLNDEERWKRLEDFDADKNYTERVLCNSGFRNQNDTPFKKENDSHQNSFAIHTNFRQADKETRESVVNEQANITEIRCKDNHGSSHNSCNNAMSKLSSSKIGTLHVVTFPLSRGPGIVVDSGRTSKTSGIYVKDVIEGGDAFQDGRLCPGDKLLTVNGYNFGVASLLQAKSVLRKLKQDPTEKIATIKFLRDSNGNRLGETEVNSADYVDFSLDQSMTLPLHLNESTSYEENPFGEQGYQSRYLQEHLILPPPLMTSTPIERKVTSQPTREDRFENSHSFTNLQHHHDGLLMIAPNTKVHLSQLESSLSYLGVQLSPHQKHMLRNQVEIDSEGYVIYEDFARAARKIYSLELSKERLYNRQENQFHSRNFVSPLPDIVPCKSINISASRKEFDRLFTEKERIKDEILEIKQRYNSKAKVLQNMEDEILEVKKELKRVQNKKQMLLKKDRELEMRRARASSNIKDYKTAIFSLEEEIRNLKAAKVPMTSQLVSKYASVEKQIQNLATRMRSVEKSNRNYKHVTQKLMEFTHKVRNVLHNDHHIKRLGRDTFSLDHTYQTVDSISLSKSKVKTRDTTESIRNKFLSREAGRIISTVQEILSCESLPFGWEEGYTERGSKFYINHVSGVTTWQSPTLN